MGGHRRVGEDVGEITIRNRPDQAGNGCGHMLAGNPAWSRMAGRCQVSLNEGGGLRSVFYAKILMLHCDGSGKTLP